MGKGREWLGKAAKTNKNLVIYRISFYPRHPLKPSRESVAVVDDVGLIIGRVLINFFCFI